MLRVCTRLSKTLDEWRAFPDDDKTTWLAWDYDQQRALERLREEFADNKLLTPEVAERLLQALYGG